ALEWKIGERDRTIGANARDHPRHISVDLLAPEGTGDRNPVMAIADEIQLSDPRQVDRRERAPATHHLGNLFPPSPNAPRGRTKAAIEVTSAVDRANDRVQRDNLETERTLTDEAECLNDFLVRQHDPNVVGLAAESSGEASDRR